MGLDPKASVVLKDRMRKLCDCGGAIFFSTHVLEVAEKLCNIILSVCVSWDMVSAVTANDRGGPYRVRWLREFPTECSIKA